ncbi:MAG: hypothetical protein GF346_07140, partial [Candidatus Eisenbacteria bacterium]|nr:hypothetical protein [Candidatus Latescibacterota bacterium]MBD3302205.1 hypothetical protein [Candidatus Eisenbacteria bacterium]
LEADAVAWSPERVRLLVPAGAVDGTVRIAGSESESNEVSFSVAPELVRFGDDLLPLFQASGCTSCHGGSGGLDVGTPADLLEGGNNGPAVIPRDSEGSLLVQKVGPNPPFGSRMPQGCRDDSCLEPGEILLISDWIDQGARGN